MSRAYLRRASTGATLPGTIKPNPGDSGPRARLARSGTTLLEIDGGGAGQFDELRISGNAAFSGGVLDVSFGSGFDPTQGESFDLISALALSHAGLTVDVTGSPSGFTFSDQFTATGFDLTTKTASGGGGGVTSASEPATWWLSLLAFGALLANPVRQRRRG